LDEGYNAPLDVVQDVLEVSLMGISAFCPMCGQEMRPDLILKNGRAVNAQQIEPEPEQIAGYGFFCEQCQRGWTGDELKQLGAIEGYP
jgi:hypothetical protein